MKIALNFGDLVNEMKEKSVKIVFLNKRHSFFLLDKEDRLYTIDNCSSNSHLDKAIIEKRVLEFRFVDSSFIKDWEKEVWDIKRVSRFIKNCETK